MKTISIWSNQWALSVLSAILLSLSFPPFDASILQLPAILFLFRIAMITESKRQFIYFTYPSLVLWNLLTTYWLMMATVGGGVAAILANALLMMIPLLLIRSVFRLEMNPILVSLLAASFWVGYEFMHHNWDLAWPWLTLGNGWSNLTGAIQYISVTGVWGISFWVVFTSALFFQYIEKQSRPVLQCAVLIFLAFPVFSIISLQTVQQIDNDPIDVVIIQPNSDSYSSYGGLSSLEALLDKLLRMSGDALTPKTDVVIWPENAIDSSLSLNNTYFNRIKDSLAVWETDLITGTGYVEYYNENNKPAVTRERTDGTHYNVFNSAFHFNQDQSQDIYKKGRLVPIVERFPYVGFFQSLDRFGWVDWGTISGYGLGTSPSNFSINGTLTPALICYDSVFPGWVREFVNEGADFLTIITNDGWWGDSNGHIQHFAYAKLRAIEHRRWIARAANNGISGIISPDGSVQVATEYWTEDAFSFTIYGSDRPTLYTTYGDWFGWLMLLISVSGAGLAVYTHRRRNLM